MLHISLPTDFNTKYKGIKQFAEQAKWNIRATHDAIIASHIKQTVNANMSRPDPAIHLGPPILYSSLIFFIVSCFVHILFSSNVVLELPEELKARKIHVTFHNSLIRPHVPNNDTWFPNQEAKAFYDFGKDDKQEWFVEEIIGHEWTNEGLQFSKPNTTRITSR
ncbi:hypothetical protein M422DRAFT_165442 [Sphaerobolus stellatus SS14]|uniref:Uncharacterized protein n=1 Tax=Sphaerobolus stellatus (strain SS14) TaxID=990650 RepID=A0A0C9W352_SPHS4|nr:hypothetical protein M422DRAFT_165442 [Sphaerobolus stellatus SS14]